MVSAFSSIWARPSSPRTSNGASVRVEERHVLGVGRQPERLPGGPSPAPMSLRLDHQSTSLPPALPAATARRRRRSLRASEPLVPGARDPLGQRDDPRQVGERRRPVRERHRLDEVLLEARLHGRLDLLDPPDHALDLGPRRAGQERDQRAGPGRVAGGPDAGEVAVGDQPEDHRVGRCRSGCRTRRPAGSRRPRPRRAGPSAAGRRRRAQPWRAGWRGRRSG